MSKTFILCTAAAAKSLQSCPTLCDPIDSSPPGSPVHGILQARRLEWVILCTENAKLLFYSPPLPSIFPSVRAFSSELALQIRWPKYWCFSLSISPCNKLIYYIVVRRNIIDLLIFHLCLLCFIYIHNWLKLRFKV